ncbi:hypothetical protein [Nonomuraea jabiensis]|uniref:hypothetical protein n=1 Tax=Nonomuraea jabiensis TaxID=882448 RepID=UPI0036A335A2
MLMLAAVHAARTGAIRSLLLDDVDLGNRRRTIIARTRPIDEFTRQILLEWLDYRRTSFSSHELWDFIGVEERADSR